MKELSAGSGNKFRFASQQQRLAGVAIEKVATARLVVDESHYLDALDRWRDLNCTAAFGRFKQETHGWNTLELLLVNQDALIAVLWQYSASHEAVEPVLDLVAALAKDLLEEFYPHLPSIVSHLVALIATHVFPF